MAYIQQVLNPVLVLFEIIGDLEPGCLVCHEDMTVGPLAGYVIEYTEPNDVLAALVLDGKQAGATAAAGSPSRVLEAGVVRHQLHALRDLEIDRIDRIDHSARRER